MQQLSHVHLNKTKVTDTGMSDLANARTLRTLSLKNTDITDAGLLQLERLARLETLDVEGTHVTAEGVAHFRKSVPRCEVTVTFGLGERPAATFLFPKEYQPTEKEINDKLSKLGIEGNVDTYFYRPNSPIVTLRLTRNKLSDESLLALVDQIPNLKRIFLDRALAGDAFVKGISTKKIRDLRLESTRVTDDGLRYVALLPKLERLVLDGANISDRGLVHLHRLRNIESIEILDNTRVTPEAVSMLTEALPGCKINYSGSLRY